MLTRRTVRAGLIGSALAVLTLAGHTAGSGALDVVGVGLVGLLSAALAAGLSARALRVPALLLVLLAGQAFLHLVLTLSAGHAHGIVGPSGPPMLAAHAVAAVLAAVVVVRADSVAAAWQAFLASVIGTEAPRPAAVAPAAPARADREPAPLAVLVLLLHGLARRGPPVSVVCS